MRLHVRNREAVGELRPRVPRPGAGWLPALSGVGLLLLGVGAVVVSSAFAPTAPRILGGNLPVNAGARDPADLSAHNSPTLARNPVDGGNLAVADRIDSPRFSCALHVSSDGGATWSQTPIPAPRGEEPKCYAPDVTFGADGTLYLSFVTLEGLGNVPNAVWVATSRDRGRTLSPPAKALGPLAFQVRLLADPAVPGRLHLSWLQASEVGLFRFAQVGNPIKAARSDDGGRTWKPPARVSDPGRQRVVAPSPAIGPRSELYVLYLDLGDDKLDYEGAHEGRGGPPYPGAWKLVLARSLDGGKSWAESVVENRLVPTERFVVFLPPYPSVAVDHRSGRLYAGFHDGRLGDADVMLWSLPPGGGTWEGPTRVNDTPERDRSSQYLPKLAVAPDGRLDVLYYDRRSDAGNLRNGVSFQSSSDGGARFTSSLRLSDRPFDSRVGLGAVRGLPDLGSRLALLSTASRALAVWTDTRAGTVDDRKQDLARAVVAVPESGGLPEPATDALRWGGLALGLVGLAVVAWALVGWRKRKRLAAAGD